jgi:hypothetical protein
VLEKDRRYQSDRSCEKKKKYDKESRNKQTLYKQQNEGRLTGWVTFASELPSKTRNSRKGRRDGNTRKKT